MPNETQNEESRPVILFDGVCNFCNGSVNFIIARDGADRFRFAPLQSEFGAAMIEKHGLSGIDSIILIEDGKAHTHSTAALRIARGLGFPWNLAYAAIVIPRFVRDIFYRAFAANRYRLFGKKDECMLPTPEVRAKFLG